MPGADEVVNRMQKKIYCPISHLDWYKSDPTF